MQMWSAGPAGSATQGDLLPLLQLDAFLHLEIGKMQIEAHQTLTMIYDHTSAFEIKRMRQNYCSAVDREYRRPGRSGKVQALMPALHFAVKDSGCAEHVRNR